MTATISTSAAPTPRLKLNPLQQWKFFSQPRVMHSWIREHYGNLAVLDIQGLKCTAVLTPDAARAVFSADPNNYEVFWRESFTNMIGEEQVWVLTGERHRRERLIFAPAVHANRFRAHGVTIREIVRHNLRGWKSGQRIKAVETTLLISLDVIMRLVFGVEESEYLEEGHRLFETLRVRAHPLVVFFPKLQKPWFPLWRRYLDAKADVLDWMNRFFATRRARNADDTDVLGALMNSLDEAGQPVTDEHIRNELNAILTAGHETTAVALGWAIYELARHPEVMEKLRAELAPLGPDFDPALALSLPYLDAVCKEAVRMHPPLAECARIPMTPIQILGQDIAADQPLVISIVGIHHDPHLYPQPDQFCPERFLERSYGIFEFLPFGGGHRRCLGAGLAEYTMRIALAEIVMHWDFEPDGLDHDTRLNVAMGPQKGIPVRIKKFNNPSNTNLPTQGASIP